VGRDVEVLVVGGGLAGVATAAALADAGHDVLILDKAAFPRAKVCGEGLLPHGVAALAELGLTPPPEAQAFRGIRWSMGGATAVGRFPRGASGIGLRRDALDARALARAKHHPRIAVEEGTSVTGLRRDAGRWIARTPGGTVSARVVVGADGLHSRVRAWAGLDAPIAGRRRYGVRQHYVLDRPVEEWVDVLVIDGAELYVTPVGPREVNVAALVEHDAMGRLKGRLAEGFAGLVAGSPLADALAGARSDEDVAVTGPLRRSSTDVVADGLVLVGDAAGFVDGITGEGMSLALRGAALAAEVVVDALRAGSVSAERLRPYARRRAALVRDPVRLTELVLWGMRHRWLATRVVRSLQRRPELFDRILAVETGEARLASIGVAGALRLVLSG
jgi:flavin-dependent dehydrogenase